jgi:hypothetical protein
MFLIIYSLPETPDAVGKVIVAFEEPVYTTYLSVDSTLYVALVVDVNVEAASTPKAVLASAGEFATQLEPSWISA